MIEVLYDRNVRLLFTGTVPVYFGTVSLVSHAGTLKGYLLGVVTEIESS